MERGKKRDIGKTSEEKVVTREQNISEPELAADEYSSSDEDEAGSSWSRAKCTTSTAATVAVAKSVGEVRPPGIAKHNEFRGGPHRRSGELS